MRRRKSASSAAKQRMAMSSLAGVMSKPACVGMPLTEGPSPVTMLRSERSLTSSTRRQSTSLSPKAFRREVLVEVVVEQGRDHVVRGGDGVEVAGEGGDSIF